MLINNLALKNYGAIKNAELEFQKGWNLISGANGQGKSHIIRSIAYLLLNKTFGKIEDDCNWDSDNFFAGLKATYQNTDFNIQTTFTSKGGVSKQCKIGDIDYTMTSEVTEALKKYFDPTLCSASILSFQGQMDIVTAKDAERREILKKIYDLSFTKEIIQLVDLKNVVEEANKIFEKELYALENKEYDIKELLLHAYTKLEYKDLQIKLSEIDAKISFTLNANKDYDRVTSEVVDLTERLCDLVKEKISYESKQEQGHKDFNDKFLELENLVTEDRVTKLREELESTKNDTSITKLQEQIDSIVLERIPVFNNETLKLVTDNYYDAVNQKADIIKRINLIREGKCPTCGNIFESGDIDKENLKLEEKIEEVSLTEQAKLMVEEEKIQYDEKLKKQTEIKQNKEHLKKEITSQEIIQKERIGFTEDKIQQTIELLERLEKEKNSLAENIKVNSKLTADTLNKIDNLEKKIHGKKEELSNLNKIDTLILEDEKKDVSSDIKNYDSIVAQNKMIKENNDKYTKLKEENAIKQVELNKQINDNIKEMNQYDEAITIYKKDLPKYIISFLLEDLKFGMNDLLNEAYSGKYQVEIKETKSGLKILYGTKQKEISLSSGAEQNLFNLGFKNAFAYLSGLQILFLDESMNFADDNIAKETFNHLNLKIEKGELDQIFIITHKQSIKEILEADYGAKVFSVEDGKVFINAI